MCTTCTGQKKTVDPLELELQVIMSLVCGGSSKEQLCFTRRAAQGRAEVLWLEEYTNSGDNLSLGPSIHRKWLKAVTTAPGHL